MGHGRFSININAQILNDWCRITFLFRFEKEGDSSLIELEDGATGPTDRKNRKRTMKKSKESRAI